MELDELKCSLCKEFYNEKERIPRLLINCGHTFCHICLKSILSNDSGHNSFKCPEDETQYSNITKVESLPKNITLIKLISKRNTTAESHILIDNHEMPSNVIQTHSTTLNTTQLNNNSSPENIFKSPSSMFGEGLRNNSTSSTVGFNIRASLRKCSKNLNCDEILNSAIQSTKSDIITHSINLTQQQNVKLCKLHPNRTLEIICLDHKIRLCTNCALFGDHKNHNIINEEDFLKEIEVKAEILIELYDLIESNLNTILNPNEVDSPNNPFNLLIELNEEKKNLIKKDVNNFCDTLILNIKNYQKKLNEEIEHKFVTVNKKIDNCKSMSKDLAFKADDWKMR